MNKKQTLKLYRYRAVDGAHRYTSGYVYGTSATGIATFLKDANLHPLLIKRSRIRLWLMRIMLPLSSRYRLTGRIKSAFFRNVGEMLEGRFPYDVIFSNIIRSTHCIPLKKQLFYIYTHVQSGRPLYYAISKAGKKLMSVREVSLIKSGEKTNSLMEIFLAIAEAQENKNSGSVAIYTYLLPLVSAILLAIFASTQVVSQFFPRLHEQVMWTGFTFTTQIKTYELLFGGDIFKSSLLYLAVLGGAFITYKCIAAIPVLADFFQWVKNKIPGLGQASKLASLSSFCFSFALASRAKMPLQTAFFFAANAIDDKTYRQDMLAISTKINLGHDFSTAIRGAKLLSSEDQYIFNNAVMSGKLAEASDNLAAYARAKLAAQVKIQVSLIRLVLIAVLVAIIGFNLLVLANIGLQFL